MRCRPWRWLWGLLPLALIAFLTVVGQRNGIQQDLVVRSEQALQSVGLGWGKVRFEGRDGILEGTAGAPEERARALEIVRAVPGVRIVEDKTDVVVAISPYAWSAQRTANRISLSGFVPDDETRIVITDLVRTQFPDADIDDGMVEGRGAPGKDVWRSGIGFSINLLKDLDQGRVGFTDTALSIEGNARSPVSFERIENTLRTRLPAGITIGKQALAAAVVSPYDWSFDRLGGAVVFNGYVPDTGTRQRLLGAAHTRYADAKISDRMRIAGGAPKGFTDVALAAVERTDALEEVRVVLRDSSLMITGAASTSDVADDVLAALRETTGGFGLTNQLRALKVAPPFADPFEWKAQWDGSRLILEGHVANDDVRAKALAFVNQSYPEAQVEDRMTLARGGPDDTSWLGVVQFGLDELAGLESGQVALKDLDLSIKGEASTQGTSREVQRAFKSAPQGINVVGVEIDAPDIDLVAEARKRAQEARLKREAKAKEERKRLASFAEEEIAAETARKAEEDAERKRKAEEERERKRLAAISAAEEAERTVRRLALREKYQIISEYNGTPLDLWKARREASSRDEGLSPADIASFDDQSVRSKGKLWLRGKVASQQDRQSLIAHARSQFDSDVADELEVLDGAPDAEWLRAAKAALTQLSRLRNGALSVSKDKVELYGDAVSADAANAVRRDIDRSAPGRYDVGFLITAPQGLKEEEVEVALKTEQPVAAEECGNLMNSVTNVAPIRFDVASANIREEAVPTLEKLAVVANKCPQTRIRVAGHTDSNGGEEYNQELSEQRATAVVSYLVEKGVARERLTARGYGESQPIVKNTTPDERAKNRRIEFTVTEQ